MTQTLAAIIVFFCTCSMVLIAYGLWTSWQQSAGANTNRRLHELRGDRHDRLASSRVVKEKHLTAPDGDADASTSDRIQKWIIQAGLDCSSTQLILLSMGAGAAFGAAAALYTNVVLWGVAVFALVAPLPLLVVLFTRHRRSKAFESQLPQAMELLARSLRAGHSFAFSLQLVHEEMADPIALEFGAIYQEQELGIPLDTCLQHLTDRVACPDLRFFAVAIGIQRETGGDLAEVLDKSSYVIRERFRILGQVRALTAEGRLSGWILVALPFVMFGVIRSLNPEYASLLTETQTGHRLLMFAAVMLVIGMAVIKKIITIKV